MSRKRNIVRTIDGPVTRDGFAISARLTPRGVRIEKSRAFDNERGDVPDTIIFSSRRAPEVTRIVVPGMFIGHGGSIPPILKHYIYVPHLHAVGIDENLDFFLAEAHREGWTDSQKNALVSIARESRNVVSNIPDGKKRYSLTADIGLVAHGYSLAGQRLLSGVQIVQRRSAYRQGADNRPEVQVFDREGLYAYNVVKIGPFSQKIRVEPNAEIFDSVATQGMDELAARINCMVSWNGKSRNDFTRLRELYGRVAPGLDVNPRNFGDRL